MIWMNEAHGAERRLLALGGLPLIVFFIFYGDDVLAQPNGRDLDTVIPVTCSLSLARIDGQDETASLVHKVVRSHDFAYNLFVIGK